MKILIALSYVLLSGHLHAAKVADCDGGLLPLTTFGSFRPQVGDVLKKLRAGQPAVITSTHSDLTVQHQNIDQVVDELSREVKGFRVEVERTDERTLKAVITPQTQALTIDRKVGANPIFNGFLVY